MLFNLAAYSLRKSRWVISLALLATLPISALGQVNPMVVLNTLCTTAQQAIDEIERSGELRFVYEGSFDTSKIVDINAGKYPLNQIMEITLRGSDRIYMLMDNVVIIKKSALPLNVQQLRANRRTSATKTISGGVVATPGGAAIEWASIMFAGINSFATTTNNSGDFQISDMPLGSYHVHITHPDYIDAQYEVEVTKEGARHYVFEMSRLETELEVTPDPVPDIVLDEPKSHAELPQIFFHETLPHFVDPPARSQSRRWAIKTNLISDFTAIASLGVELRLGLGTTLDIPLSINLWNFSDNKKWRQYRIQPELRFWSDEPFNRYFWGVNALYAQYNVGGIDLPFGFFPSLRDHRFQGHLFGAGVSIGRQWRLSDRLNLEVTFGLGYFYTRYKKYECFTCGSYLDKGVTNYLGPTKAGLSLVYVFR